MFSFFSKKDKSSPEPPEQYTNTRNSILMSSAMQLNIQPSGKNPDVWGILIDENFGKHIQSVWATANGQLRIFQYDGESRMREDSRMTDLLRLLLFIAEACYSSLTPVTTCPLPISGNIRFSIFAFTGLYSSEVEVRELAISKGEHTLASLNNSYHNILFLNKWGKLQFPINTSIFEPKAASEPTKIYSKPDFNSTPIAELTYGNGLELGVLKDAGGKKWFSVTLPSGQWGYMPAETKILSPMQLSLFEDEAVIYSEPSTQSAVVARMKKNARYETIPSGSQDENWAKIRDSAGNEGFIDARTRGKKIQ